MAAYRECSPSAPRLALGLVITLLGVLFLADKLGYDVGHVWDYWPLILVAIGAGRVLQPAGSHGRGFGVVLIAVGTWMLLANLDAIPYDFGDVWPILLVLLGVSLVWRATIGQRLGSRPPTKVDLVASDFSAPLPATEGAMPPPPPVDIEPTVHAVAIMGGIERKISAQDFRGGDLTAIMGGCELDLRQASIATGPAVLDVFAMWGGIELRVPPDWTIAVRATPILGAIEDKTGTAPRDGRKTLIIKGAAVMGGVEIKN
ncbi:MAG: DUF5668 domain-containing protein [Acidobacteriota bacterium]